MSVPQFSRASAGVLPSAPMTSLARQLSQIKNPEFTAGTGSGHRHANKERPSILYEPKVAAQYDFDDIFAIAEPAFNELVRLNPDFETFRIALFSEAARACDRVLMPLDPFNKNLDRTIHAFLRLLSRFMLSSAATKVLEWLIRRFRVNEFNVNSVIYCVLPYYETRVFTVVLSVLQLEKLPQWAFLTRVVDFARPMERLFFMRRIFTEPHIISSVCYMVKSHVDCGTGFSALFNFFTSTLLSYLSSIDEIPPVVVSNLTATIQDALLSDNTDWRLSNYLVLSQLCTRVPFSEPTTLLFIKTLISKINHTLPKLQKKTTQQIILVLFSMCVSQHRFPGKQSSTSLSSTESSVKIASDFSPLVNNKHFVSFFRELALKYDTNLFLDCLRRVFVAASAFKEIGRLALAHSFNSHAAATTLLFIFNADTKKENDTDVGTAVALISRSCVDENVIDSAVEEFLASPRATAASTWAQSRLHVCLANVTPLRQIVASRRISIAAALRSDDIDCVLDALGAINKILHTHYERRSAKLQSDSTVEIGDSADVGSDEEDITILTSQNLRDCAANIISTLSTSAKAAIFALTQKDAMRLLLTSNSEKLASALIESWFIHFGPCERGKATLVQIGVYRNCVAQLDKEKVNTELQLFGIHLDVLLTIFTRISKNPSFSLNSVLQEHLDLPLVSVDDVLLLLQKPQHYAFTALALVSSTFLQDLKIRNAVQSLVCQKLPMPVWETALKKAITVCSADFLLTRLINFPDDCFARAKHSIALLYTKLDNVCSKITFLVKQLFTVKTETTVIGKTRILTWLNEILEANKDKYNFNILLLFVVPLFNCENIPVRQAAGILLNSIANNVASNLTALTLVQLGLVSQDQKIVVIEQKQLRLFVEDLKKSDLVSSHHGITTVVYRNRSVSALAGFLSISATLGLNLVRQWLSLCSNVDSHLPFSALHTYIRSWHSVISSLILVEMKPSTYDEPFIFADLTKQLMRSISPTNIGKILQSPGTLETIIQLIKGHSNMAVEQIQLSVLQKITPAFWAAMSQAKQYEFLMILVNIVGKSSHSDAVREAKSVLSVAPISTEQIVRFFANFFSTIKKRKNVSEDKSSGSSSTKPAFKRLRKLGAILELLTYREIKDSYFLMRPLFDTLQFLLTNCTTYVHFDYILQLVLSALLRVERRSSEESSLKIDLLVSCIRSTDNPQTHNSVLMVLAAVAELCPEKVLLYFMPIFTFMGAHVLRQDDEYTFSVIEATVRKIVPSLILSKVEVVSIIQVFVDAVEFIPRHRRLRLFTALVQTLSEHYLCLVIALLLDKNHTDLLEFGLLLASEFSAMSQLRSMNQLLGMSNSVCLILGETKKQNNPTQGTTKKNSVNVVKLQSAEEMQIDKPTQLVGQKRTREQMIEAATKAYKMAPINTQGKSGTEQKQAIKIARHESGLTQETIKKITISVITFVEENLAMRTFIETLATEKEDEVEPVAKSLMLELLSFVQIHKEDKVSLKLTYRALEKIQHLLAIPTLVSVLRALWAHESSIIQRRSVVLFNDRLTHWSKETLDNYSNHIMPLLGDIVTMLSPQKVDDDPELAQLAIIALQRMCATYGPKNPKLFALHSPTLFPLVSSKIEPLRASAYSCAAQFVRTIREHFLPHFNALLKGAAELYTTKGTLARLSALAVWHACAETLPQFLTTPLLTQLIESSITPIPVNEENQSRHLRKQLLERSQSFFDVLASKAEVRSIVAAATLTYPKIASTSTADALKMLLSTVNKSLVNAPNRTAKAMVVSIFKSFHLPLLELECKNNIVVRRDAVANAASVLVLQLSDSLFTPLHTDIVTWVYGNVGTRLCAGLRLAESLFSVLKHLYIPHFKQLHDCIITALDKECKQITTGLSVAAAAVGAVHGLCTNAVSAGSEDVAAYLEGGKTYEISSRMARHLACTCDNGKVGEALVGLACAVPTDAHRRVLNGVLLDIIQQSQAFSCDTRCASLRVLGQIYRRVGEPYLVLLPESIPVLAECLEDVELEEAFAATRAEIETVLGEPLQKFLEK